MQVLLQIMPKPASGELRKKTAFFRKEYKSSCCMPAPLCHSKIETPWNAFPETMWALLTLPPPTSGHQHFCQSPRANILSASAHCLLGGHANSARRSRTCHIAETGSCRAATAQKRVGWRRRRMRCTASAKVGLFSGSRLIRSVARLTKPAGASDGNLSVLPLTATAVITCAPATLLSRVMRRKKLDLKTSVQTIWDQNKQWRCKDQEFEIVPDHLSSSPVHGSWRPRRARRGTSPTGAHRMRRCQQPAPHPKPSNQC